MQFTEDVPYVTPQNKKFRHEYKHSITYADFLTLRGRLSEIMRLDANVGEEGNYRIRSLYFDNLYDKVLREKIDGVSKREKFRIRFYNDDFTYIKLEKKVKNHGLCGKDACSIQKNECERLLAGDRFWMSCDSRGLLTELYVKMKLQLLKPRLLVTYSRIPYVYPAGNVRVTLDYDIRSGLYQQNLFDLRKEGVLAPDKKMILEVKYDEFLPEIIQKAVQLKDRSAQAYSKYAVCRCFG